MQERALGTADAVTYTFGPVVPNPETAETPVEEAAEEPAEASGADTTETAADESAEPPITAQTF